MSTGNAELVRTGFQAFLRGDFDALEELMDPEVQWLWFEPGERDCHDRDKVLATLRARQQEGVVTGLNDIVEGGEQVLVEVTGPSLEQWGLPEGQANMVITIRDGRIVRMQDHRSRADALAGAGLARKPAPEPPARPEYTEPGRDRVIDLIPFTHVSDVDVSITFYERLGFQVTETFAPTPPRTSWAALESGQARVMLARADAPIDPDRQAVLFYLYSRDLYALRDKLVAAGVNAGEIHDGAPGPKAEMRVEDPDGYVLMIAQIETDQSARDS